MKPRQYICCCCDVMNKPLIEGVCSDCTTDLTDAGVSLERGKSDYVDLLQARIGHIEATMRIHSPPWHRKKTVLTEGLHAIDCDLDDDCLCGVL